MALDPITLRPPSPDDAALSELLVRELLARTKASGLALVGAMTLMWLIVRDAVPVWTCALFIAVVVFAALRVVGTLWLERQVPFPVRRAFYWFLALGALIGLTLGVIVLVTFRDLSLARIEMCSIVVVGIDFGAMVSLAASPLVFAAYVSGNIAALMFGAFAYDVEASHVYQAMQIVFSVSVFAMARVVHLSLRAHFELRLEVARHLAELKATQAQLVETSRLAGRADVASAVIHNVGNVLNSVNVSAQLVRDTVVGWRTAGLARVATILEELRAAGTLRTDPRGGTVVAYLTELSAAMERDKRAVGVEVEALQRNRAFVEEYRLARAAWLAGTRVAFPPGTYWLRRFANVPIAA